MGMAKDLLPYIWPLAGWQNLEHSYQRDVHIQVLQSSTLHRGPNSICEGLPVKSQAQSRGTQAHGDGKGPSAIQLAISWLAKP